MDEGTGYGRPAPSCDDELVQVGAGTAAGELLRRYWHPVATSAEATATPRAVRVLGEDLVLFRDGRGRPGLVHDRCCHRGTTLYYGKVEEDGIRCCYHGWLFDPEGRCLDQPVEVGRGRHRDRYRQPWYPVQEYLGMVFAYLGPPDRKPLLPRYDVLETVEDGWELVADSGNIGLEGDPTPCNWFQTHENVMDPFHVFVLHVGFSGNQFVSEMAALPEVSWHPTERGVVSHQDRRLADGSLFHRVTEVVLPNVRIVASPFVTSYGPSDSVAWTLPIDDTHTKIVTLYKRPIGTPHPRALYDGRRWGELAEPEHQRFPGDYEAQVGQGEITFHSEENLAGSDRGVVLFRHAFRLQVRAVAEGRDPVGVTFPPDDARYRVQAGNFLLDAAGAAGA
jgi:nitrite reductase/ring-hydroxylating ferredoxin subunit